LDGGKPLSCLENYLRFNLCAHNGVASVVAREPVFSDLIPPTMRTLKPIQAFSAAAAIASLAACSGGSAIAPKPASGQSIAYSAVGRVSSLLGPMGMLGVKARTAHHFKSFYACPATGSIEYLSDVYNQIITIYSGKFAGQAPCGQITEGLDHPSGMFVESGTHDLYVANQNVHDILVFHRGQTSPYNTYADPSDQLPLDVAVARDGTVIASNESGHITEAGSLSTWVGGPNGGTFVDNFPMTNDLFGVDVTIRKNGLVYYDDKDSKTMRGAIWSLTCPAGVCGRQTKVKVAPFQFADGLAIDDTGDLLMNDLNGFADTYELPNPQPSQFPIVARPEDMAIDKSNHHWFTADQNGGDEYSYPSGKPIGTVSGNQGGFFVGMAVDR